jgi:hypothetical protein
MIFVLFSAAGALDGRLRAVRSITRPNDGACAVHVNASGDKPQCVLNDHRPRSHGPVSRAAHTCCDQNHARRGRQESSEPAHRGAGSTDRRSFLEDVSRQIFPGWPSKCLVTRVSDCRCRAYPLKTKQLRTSCSNAPFLQRDFRAGAIGPKSAHLTTEFSVGPRERAAPVQLAGTPSGST